jgi:uncharacterized phage protein gp47/JayE
LALSVYTRDELRDIVLAHIRGRVPGANAARYSDYWMLATATATVVHGDQAAAQYLVQQVLPSTAEKKFLDAHAAIRQLTRLQPAKASGKLLVQGAALISIASGLTLTHAGGGAFAVTASAITALPAWATKTIAPGTSLSRLILNADASSIAVGDLLTVTGYDPSAVKAILPDTGTPVAVDLYRPLVAVPSSGVNVDPLAGVIVLVEASATGAAGNLEPGDVLPFDSAPAGVTEDPIVLEMSGGGDLETDEELRARVLAWLAERPGAGNREDFRQWARETPDVRLDDAFVYPAYRGLGTVDVVPMGVAGARVTGTAVNDLVQTRIESQASFQDDILVRQLADATPIAVDVSVQVGTGYEPDFSNSITTSASQPSVSEVSVISDPTGIEVGDRVLVKAGTKAPRLFQRAVTGKKVAPYRLVLGADLPDFPTASVLVYPGGPNAQALIDAFTDLFDTLGPGDTDPSTRHPSPADAYSDELPLARVDAVVMAVAGVRDVAITSPATDQFPATLTRLALGQLTIRLTTAAV